MVFLAELGEANTDGFASQQRRADRPVKDFGQITKVSGENR